MDDLSGCSGCLAVGTVAFIGLAITGVAVEWARSPEGVSAFGMAVRVLAFGGVAVAILWMTGYVLRGQGFAARHRAEELKAMMEVEAFEAEREHLGRMRDEQFLAVIGPLPLPSPGGGLRRYELWSLGPDIVIIPSVPEPGRLSHEDLPRGSRRTHVIKASSLTEARSKAIEFLGLAASPHDDLVLKPKPPGLGDDDLA